MKMFFVLMLINLSSLATTSKIQNNICFKMNALIQKNVKVVAIYESSRFPRSAC